VAVWEAEASAEEADAERRQRDGLPRNSSSREAIASTRWPLRYFGACSRSSCWSLRRRWPGALGGDRGGTRFSPLARSRRPMSAISCAPGSFVPRSRGPSAGSDGTHEIRGDAAVCREQSHLLFALQRGDRGRSGSGAQKWRYDPGSAPASAPEIAMSAAALPTGSTIGRPKVPPAGADFHGHQRCPRDRARCPNRHSLRRFWRWWRGQDRYRQAAGVAGRIPDHVGSGGEPRRRHCRLFDLGQRPCRCAIRRGARLRRAKRVARWSWDPLVHDGIVAGTANVWAPMSSDEERGLLFCRHRRRARISGAASGPAMTRTPIRWWRCAPRPENWCGRSRPRITMSGIMICRHSRRWRASIPAREYATSSFSRPNRVLFSCSTATPANRYGGRGAQRSARAAEGEQLSPTQPFPTTSGAGAAADFSHRRIQAVSDFPQFLCEKRLAAARNEGLYTPPSTQGTLIFP